MTTNKLPPLPELPAWIAIDTPGADYDTTFVLTRDEARDLIETSDLEQVGIELFTAGQMRAYAAEAIRQSQSLPAGAVAGLVGKWRDNADDVRSNQPVSDWQRAEEMEAAADELEQAIHACDGELPGMWSQQDFTSSQPDEVRGPIAEAVADAGDLPVPAFRLMWRNGAYYVSEPSICDTDCYTAEQLHAARAQAFHDGQCAALQADAREKGEAVDSERFRELPAKWLHERAEMASARRGHNPHNEGIIATLDRCARELEARLIATQPAQASEPDHDCSNPESPCFHPSHDEDDSKLVGAEAVAGKVNGYLFSQRAIEVIVDGEIPEWMSRQPGIRVNITPEGANQPAHTVEFFTPDMILDLATQPAKASEPEGYDDGMRQELPRYLADPNEVEPQ